MSKFRVLVDGASGTDVLAGDIVTLWRDDDSEMKAYYLQSGSTWWIHDRYLEPITTRTLTVGETYTTKGGRKLVCIFILESVAFMQFDYGGGATGEAYRYNLDGTSISHSAFPDEYDIKFEPVVEWVERHLNYDPTPCEDECVYTGHHDEGDNFILRFPLIDGKPDWSQATVTPQPPN